MSGDFHPCPRCAFEANTAEGLRQHMATTVHPEIIAPVKAPPRRRRTGDDFEKLVKHSAKTLAPEGLRLRKRGPEFVGEVHASGRAVGRLLGKGGLDFEGYYQGRYVAFDAKSTVLATRFDLGNIEEHQAELVKQACLLGAIGFLLVEFSHLADGPRYFVLDWPALAPWWDGWKTGGRASIPFAYFTSPVGATCEVRRAGRVLDLLGAVRAVAARMPDNQRCAI